MRETFGQRLKKVRDTKNITQTELSKYLNVSSASISQYESDVRTPDYALLIKIADYFDVSIDYLLGRTDNKEINRDKKEIITISANISDSSETNIDTLKLKEIIREVLREETKK